MAKSNKKKKKIKRINNTSNSQKRKKRSTNKDNKQVALNIVNDASIYNEHRNVFCYFKSIISNKYYLVYINENKSSIIWYDILNKQKINSIIIKLPVATIRHFCDEKNKRDLIMTIHYDNAIKVFNIFNCECILEINNINVNEGDIDSACFINDNNTIYIATSEYKFEKFEHGNCDPIKIFDLTGTKIKEINNSNEATYTVDCYYDKKLSKIFLITNNDYHIKSYDFYENKLYHKYMNSSSIKYMTSGGFIYDNEDIIKLVEPDNCGNLKFWNFHTGDLMKIINIGIEHLDDICFWNNNLLFISTFEEGLILYDINKEKCIQKYKVNGKIIAIRKIIHPEFGECILTHYHGASPIQLWKQSSLNI